MGVIADALQANLRALAQSDARFFRELAELDRNIQSAIDGGPSPALPSLPSSSEMEIAAAIRLLEAHGYTVIPPVN